MRLAVVTCIAWHASASPSDAYLPFPALYACLIFSHLDPRTVVQHTAAVAEGFLKESGIKLSHKKTTYTKSVWRRASYEQGKVDSKEIDINQRSLSAPSSST